MLKLKGFSDKWCDLIMQTIRGGHVAVKVNGSLGQYFNTHQGLRQGDPLSPILFDLAVDGLAILIDRAKNLGFVNGVSSEYVEGGLAILQYADDTLFFLEDDVRSAQNLKFILCVFEQMSGLKINFDKSELYCFGEAEDRKMQYEMIFSCVSGQLPMKYLGIPIDKKRIMNKDWNKAEEKMEGKLGCWQGKLLAIGGRVELIKSSLTSIPLYMMSFYSLPVGVRKKFDFFQSRFLWGEDQGIRKYHLVNWDTVCLPKDYGGLGILDLKHMNVALLGKWLWKLETEQGLWQDLLRKKYLRDTPLSGASFKPGDSWFWHGLMSVKKAFYNCCCKEIGDGKGTLFWEEQWKGDDPFAVRFKELYDICTTTGITVEKVLLSRGDCLRFRRSLTGTTLRMWDELRSLCRGVLLSDSRDTIKWKLGGKGFSVKSFYRYLKARTVKFPKRFLWKVIVPNNIKKIMWLVARRSILTKDVLTHRGWEGDSLCQFCNLEEDADHLLFRCPMARYVWNVARCAFGFRDIPSSIDHLYGAWRDSFDKQERNLIMVGAGAIMWSIWKMRNNACFRSIRPNDPVIVTNAVCHWISSWAILQVKVQNRDALNWGAKLFARLSSEVFQAVKGWRPATRRLL